MAELHSKSKEVTPPQVEFHDIPFTQYAVDRVSVDQVYPKNALGGVDTPIEYEYSGSGDAFLDMAYLQWLVTGRIEKLDGTPIKSKILPVPKTRRPPRTGGKSATSAAGTAEGTGSGTSAAATDVEAVDSESDDDDDEYDIDYDWPMKDGKRVDGPDNIGPVNHFLDAIIHALIVKYNGKQVTPYCSNRFYGRHFENMLAYGSDACRTHMPLRLSIQDTPGHMDDITGKNKGLQARKKITDNSATFEMLGPLHADVFALNRYLLNNVKVEIKIVRRPSAFCLMGDKDEYRFKIDQAILLVKKVHLNPDAANKITASLTKQPAIYPYKRHEIRTFKIGHDETFKVVDHLFTGKQPSSVVVGFVEEVAYHGKIDRNPLDMVNLDIASFHVVSAGQQFPTTSLKPDFSKPGMSRLTYATIISAMGIHHGDEGNRITLKAFRKGCMLICLDLTQDHSAASGTHWNTRRLGNFRLEMALNRPYGKSVVGIVYAEFDSIMQITAERNVALLEA
jgi:hypothetical protein